MKKDHLSRILFSFTLLAAGSFGLVACGGGGGGEGDEGGGGGGDDRFHYAGRDCMASGCHDGSAEADKRWSYAGTVYTDATGTDAASGVTVVITQTNGTQISLTTDSLGNFWTRTGSPVAGYAARVSGGAPMVSQPANGSCSLAGCHGSGTLKIYQN